jgi:hypothetical protein
MVRNVLLEWGEAHRERLAVIHGVGKIGYATDVAESLKDKNSFLEKDRNFGRYLVIKDETVIADYPLKATAWRATIQTHTPGTFIIHHCFPESEKGMRHLTNHQLVVISE